MPELTSLCLASKEDSLKISEVQENLQKLELAYNILAPISVEKTIEENINQHGSLEANAGYDIRAWKCPR